MTSVFQPRVWPRTSTNGDSHSTIASNLSFALLGAAIAYAVANGGGVDFTRWNVSLLLVGLAGVAYIAVMRTPILQPRVRWTLVMVSCYVAFQLIPLPVMLVKLLSPERAHLFEAVKDLGGTGNFIALSIQPATTYLYLLRTFAYTLTFLLMCGMTARSRGQQSWRPAVLLICVAAIEAGFAFLRNSGRGLLEGTYGSKNHFAGLLEMVLPFAVMRAAAVIRQQRSVVKLAALGGVIGAVALTFLGLVYSMSKMGLVSALFGIFIVGALWLSSSRIRASRKAWLLVAMALTLLIAFVAFIPDELVQAFGHLVTKRGVEDEGRWAIWIDTMRLIAAYPLFGCGLGNYETAFVKYQTAIVDRDFTFAHNDYLQLAAELGFFGTLILASFVVFVILALRSAMRDPDRDTRYLAFACAGGIGAIAFHSLADFNTYIPANAMVLTAICGISFGLTSRTVWLRPASQGSFEKKFAIALSSMLIIYAPAWLLFENHFRSQPQVEAAFCRFGICDTDAALAAESPKQNEKGSPPWRAALVEAVRRDPAAPRRWCDLGDAMWSAGDAPKAKYCFSKALALGPNIPALLFRAAGFHFALGDNRGALELMARVLTLDSGYEDAVLSDYEQRKITTPQILRYGIPHDANNFKDYLRRMLYQNRLPDAAETWAWITSRGDADDKLANEYIELLISDQKSGDAQDVWAHYACARDKSYPEANRVFNGGFELDPTGSRFDWVIEPHQGAAVDFDDAVHLTGARSLRIRFDGTQNLTEIGVAQTLFLKPGRYRLDAYTRTEDVSTDEGVALRVVDPDQPNLLNVVTEGAVGTNGWKRVEHTFEVLPKTKLVELSLIRKSSLRFDNLIRGTVWIDAVAITPSL